MRIKSDNIIKLKTWEQIVEFSFLENGKDMKWKEKFFITSKNEKQANDMSKKLIERKKLENKNVENFQYFIVENISVSNRIPNSFGPSIYSHIIDINIV